MSWLSSRNCVDQFGAMPSEDAGREGSRHQTLKGKIIVVADGSTAVGSGIIQELLKEGAVVVAPLPAEEDVDELMAQCAGCPTATLFPVLADVADEAACGSFIEDVVQQHGSIDHAVSCFGDYWTGGPLSDQSLSDLQGVLSRAALTHFVFGKHALRALKQSRAASMLFVTDGAGKRMLSPDTSLHTVAAATSYGIVLAAQDQYAEAPLRVNEMRLYAYIKRHEDLADKSYEDVCGLKAYSNRKIGRLVVEALMASKHAERFVVTPSQLDGATLTV